MLNGEALAQGGATSHRYISFVRKSIILALNVLTFYLGQVLPPRGNGSSLPSWPLAIRINPWVPKLSHELILPSRR